MQKLHFLWHFLLSQGLSWLAGVWILSPGSLLRGPQPAEWALFWGERSDYHMLPVVGEKGLDCPMVYCPVVYCPMVYCPVVYCPMVYCPMGGKRSKGETARQRDRDRWTERQRERQMDRETETDGQRDRERETDGQGDRERDRWTERQRQMDRETERETDGQRERQMDREPETETDGQRDRERETDGQRDRERQMDRETETETDGQRDRERDRWTERQRERQMDRETERERQRNVCELPGGFPCDVHMGVISDSVHALGIKGCVALDNGWLSTRKSKSFPERAQSWTELQGYSKLPGLKLRDPGLILGRIQKVDAVIVYFSEGKAALLEAPKTVPGACFPKQGVRGDTVRHAEWDRQAQRVRHAEWDRQAQRVRHAEWDRQVQRVRQQSGTDRHRGRDTQSGTDRYRG
ncbi:hypothetical protein P4O66_007762 [Electrophorus voltai]|uniref:Uncharacterized protein n=1 Tax=Electrophorus voltai TaxID=2609070 RepID=A0AAD9DY37_9TELE|nr:hypothetical protein P4O66_007762 [Electrophorus voltai]